jgi:tRNA G10  N-methylase Trm11
LPQRLWEPAAGDGAIVQPLRLAGYEVIASDLVDYGGEGITPGVDYLDANLPGEVDGIVTNPPYRLAIDFARKALYEAPYVALLLRTNFLESVGRLSFFRWLPPSRIWISSRRLPMMHRYGWSGPTAPSNTCFAWFIWEAGAGRKRELDWFDWQNLPAV